MPGQSTTLIGKANSLTDNPEPARQSRRGLPRWIVFVMVHAGVTAGQALIRMSVWIGAGRAFKLARWLTLRFEPLTRKRRVGNLEHFFGSTRSLQQLESLDRAHQDYLARMRSQVARSFHSDPAQLNETVVIHGEEYLRETLARGRGTLLVSGHTGTWWFAPAALAARGYPVTAVFTPIKSARVERILVETTRRYNVRLAFVGRDAYRAARRAIERNEILYLTFDVAVRSDRAVSVPFGEGSMLVDPGPAIMAVRNSMPTLQAACAQVDARLNAVSIYSPNAVEIAPESGTAEDLCRLWTDRLEKEIRLHPEQWWPWGYTALSNRSAASAQAPVRFGRVARR